MFGSGGNPIALLDRLVCTLPQIQNILTDLLMPEYMTVVTSAFQCCPNIVSVCAGNWFTFSTRAQQGGAGGYSTSRTLKFYCDPWTTPPCQVTVVTLPFFSMFLSDGDQQ
ncbi:hypothetical protein EON65_07550 [archaeon]|nr:MAG: hypothetical protein EON65_07550 [archaeon]